MKEGPQSHKRENYVAYYFRLLWKLSMMLSTITTGPMAKAVSVFGASAPTLIPTADVDTPAGSPSAPLSWNEFQASVKGQGLSKEEKSRRYREQRSGG